MDKSRKKRKGNLPSIFSLYKKYMNIPVLLTEPIQ